MAKDGEVVKEKKGHKDKGHKDKAEGVSYATPISILLILVAITVAVTFHSLEVRDANRAAVLAASKPAAAQARQSQYPLLPDLTSRPLFHESKLEIVAELPVPPGNLAVSATGRIFFTFHPLSNPKIKVAEWDPKTKTYAAYPSEDFQELEKGGYHSILSIRIDGQGRLWVLDFADNGQGQPAFFVFDLDTNQLLFKYDFPKDIAPAGSMLNDFQITADSKLIYIADTSIAGNAPGLIIFNAETKTSRRVLHKHTSVYADPFVPIINGQPFFPDVVVQIHVDSIALDKAGEWLYYAACNKEYLFRIKTSYLLDENLSADQLGSKVERFAKKTMSDGLTIDTKGNIFLTDFEHSAVTVIDQKRQVSTLVQSNTLLRWPDGFSFDTSGYLYIASSYVHRLFTGQDVTSEGPFHILRIRPGFTTEPQVAGQ